MKWNRYITPTVLSLTGYLLTAIIVLTMAIGIFHYIKGSSISISKDDRIDATPNQIASIKNIAEWEFLSINDEELVDTVRRGFFGDDELVRIYYGTLRLGINLNKAEEDWIKVEKDTIICKLPPIELLDENFIDEAQTRSFFEEGKWNAKDKQKLYERARTMMRKRCMTKANINTAEENAKEQFSKMLTSIGNKNVKVTFEEK